MKFEDFNILDIGNKLEITGVVYGDNNRTIVIMLPGEDSLHDKKIEVLTPTLEQWLEIVKQSDILQVEVIKDNPNKKIILRKSTRNIDQKVSWEVFRRDKYTCRYCGKNDVPLTVDHVVLWEQGGPTIPINLISSCKKCNNARGNTDYEVWLDSKEYKYLSKDLSLEQKTLNQTVVNNINIVKKHYLLQNKRNR